MVEVKFIPIKYFDKPLLSPAVMGYSSELTDTGIFIIEGKQDSDKLLKDMIRFKAAYMGLQSKLLTKFVDKAPKEVVEDARKKLEYNRRMYHMAAFAYTIA